MLRPSYKDIESVYGVPGDPANLTKFVPPYPMYIAWGEFEQIRFITCHKLIASDLENALKEILEYYGLDFIEEHGLDMYGGCFNLRKMRGSKKWSTHAWGIALDKNPAENRWKWKKDKAQFAHPRFDKMFEIFKKWGFYSLGREKGYDYMHVQAVLP